MVYASQIAPDAEFDYVIVGAGSAGCVLAHRLSSDPSVRVALLEAGPRDDSALIRTPAAVGALLRHPLYNWNFRTTPQRALNNRVIPVPRGRVLGGTGSINGMVYTRGHPKDFDEWARAGCRGWSYRDVLPYFIRSENNEAWPDSPYHGVGGPMNVIDIVPHNPLVDRFVDAAASLGYRRCEDFNAGEPDGFGPRQATIRRGRRESTAAAFLRPAVHRGNLAIFTNTLARRILIESGRATGVEYERGGAVARVKGRAEVILCAGAIGSPHLLMLSGVGDSGALRPLGIVPRCHLPAVGANLQDHLAITIAMRTQSTESYGLSWRTLPRALWTLADYVFRHRGALASNVFEAHGFVRTQPAIERPDVQIIFIPAHRNASGFPIPIGHGLGINVALLRPWSRGTISLAGPDPHLAPAIDPNVLSVPSDLNPLIRGFRIARSILRAPAFESCVATELAPGIEVQTDREIEEYVRRSAFTVFHPCGTCRMGGDADSVVDAQLRVRGVTGLRVADASVFPTIVGGNTNAAVVMVAEKAADLIRSVAPPLPVKGIGERSRLALEVVRT